MIGGAVRKFVRLLKDIFSSSKTGYKVLTGDQEYWLEIEDEDDIRVIEIDDVPEKAREKLDSEDLDLPRAYNQRAKNFRTEVLNSKHPKQVARKATNNHKVLSDVLNDPGLVDAETPGEAVEFIAETNPSWAKMADIEAIAPEADVEADTDTEVEVESGSTDASVGSGSSSGSDVAGVASGSIDTTTGEVDISTGNSASSGNSAGSGNSASSGNSAGGGNSP